MTNENDLIRRGFVASAIQEHVNDDYDRAQMSRAIAALPAVAASPPADPVVKADSCQRVTVKPLVFDDLGIASDDLLNQTIVYSKKEDQDRHNATRAARILATIETTPDPRDAVIAGQAEALTAANAYITDLIRHEGQEGFSNSTYDLGVAYDKALAAIAAAKGGAA